MRDTSKESSFIKVIGLLLLSFIGIINCVVLYFIGKKIKSVFLQFSSIVLLIISVGAVVGMYCIDSGTTLQLILMRTAGICIFTPTILCVCNIKKYKKECVQENDKETK